jgi:hypothetical protein
MTRRPIATMFFATLFCTTLLAAGPALAERSERPPQGSIAASEVLRLVEQRPDFASIEEMEWDDDGYWEVEYRTRDDTRRKLRLNPRDGSPISR